MNVVDGQHVHLWVGGGWGGGVSLSVHPTVYLFLLASPHPSVFYFHPTVCVCPFRCVVSPLLTPLSSIVTFHIRFCFLSHCMFPCCCQFPDGRTWVVSPVRLRRRCRSRRPVSELAVVQELAPGSCWFVEWNIQVTAGTCVFPLQA